MMWTVILKDRISDEEVVVADLCNRAEVSELRRVLSKYNACDIVIVECNFIYRKEDKK